MIAQNVQLAQEFNNLIADVCRPYFLGELNLLNNATVFDESDRTFPPMKRVLTIDTVKLRAVIDEPGLISRVSQLRMSMGAYLMRLERIIQANDQLIKNLEERLKE